MLRPQTTLTLLAALALLSMGATCGDTGAGDRVGLAANETPAGRPALPPAGAPGVRKKLIEFGWDEPDPSFMRRHIREMEATPFDGCVFHVAYVASDGAVGRFTWESWGRRAFTVQEVQGALDDLKATPLTRFTHNFLRFNTTPGDVDWFDDFSAILSNARLASRLARAGRCKGILFDLEHYQAKLWDYRGQRDAGGKSWDEYAAQARRRGSEVMRAFQDSFPDVTIFLSFGYSTPWLQMEGGKRPLADCSYGLIAPFLDGMVEAATGNTRLIDGHESAYGFRDTTRFERASQAMKRDLLPIVRDRAKYARVVSLSYGIWMDHDWRRYGWDTLDVAKNFFTPTALETSVRKALSLADEYVWIYSETPRWWSDGGVSVKLPEAYDAALRRALGTPAE